MKRRQSKPRSHAGIPERQTKRQDACPPLSQRQIQIVKLVAEGLTNAGIAAELHISPETVGTHMKEIYRRYRVHCRVELITRWFGETHPLD